MQLIFEATDENIRKAAERLKEGGLVAMPTETVYGLGADATNDRAVASIFAAKGRPVFNPVIVHFSNKEESAEAVVFNDKAAHLAELFWPGPLTLILPRREGCKISLLLQRRLANACYTLSRSSCRAAAYQGFGQTHRRTECKCFRQFKPDYAAACLAKPW